MRKTQFVNAARRRSADSLGGCAADCLLGGCPEGTTGVVLHRSLRGPSRLPQVGQPAAQRAGQLALRRRASALALALLAASCPSQGAEPPKAPVPKSPYIAVVYRFADTLLERARDTVGPQQTGLFLSALDRATLAPLTNRPPAPPGVRESERAGGATVRLVGANLQHDENLLRLLYSLSELSSKPKYRDAADGALRWFLQHGRITATGPPAWGRHGFWDALADVPVASRPEPGNDFSRPWLLWDHCFALAPEASAAWLDGEFEGHSDSLRETGFLLRGLAVAYARTKQTRFLKAVEEVAQALEQRRHPGSGWLDPGGGQTELDVADALSLAIDCDGAAHHVPAPWAARLRALAARQDELFCALPHDVRNSGGFITRVHHATGQPLAMRSPLWSSNAMSTAQLGLMCVSRYDNTGQPGYRELILAAAEKYRSAAAAGGDVWPRAFGLAISLQVAAWRHSADPACLGHARVLADRAVERFWGTNALPRAGGRSEHYESITGADTLALALLELHLQILHITAVRCPSNTIDR